MGLKPVIATALVATAATAAWLSASPAHAAPTNYGSGAYSNCAGQAGCVPTVTTAPSSLRFSVNLSTGQTLPASQTYKLVVTPLNDSTTNIAITKVELYVDDTLEASFLPGDSGGANYSWLTPASGTHAVRVVVYSSSDPLGVSQAFELKFSGTAAGSNSPNPTPAPNPTASPSVSLSSNPIIAAGQLAQAAADSVAQAVKNLIAPVPAPVVASFPYVLLALLFGGLVFAFVQARTEIAHAKVVAALAKRQQALAADKDTFVQLLSHYLRTPLTILEGALDNGVVLNEIDAPAAATVKASFAGLEASIESSLSQINGLVTGSQPASVLPGTRAWLKPGFALPLLLIALLFTTINLLSVASGKLSASLINTLTQAGILALLAFVWYVLVRGRSLRQAEAATSAAQAAEQARVDTLKNNLIHQAGAALAQKGSALRTEVGRLKQGGPCVKQLQDACDRLDKLNRAFTLAAQLEAGRASEPPVSTSLAPIVAAAIGHFGATAAAHPVQTDSSINQSLALRHPDWLINVLVSLLDNAAAYSAEGTPITVQLAQTTAGAALSVTDHGQGIPADYLERLFTPFAKAEGALNFNHMGLGFSLFLDRLIMHYLSGEITVSSTVGQGTTVTLNLPSN